LPLPRPHFEAAAAGLAVVLAAAPPLVVDALSLSSPPHATASSDRLDTSARTAIDGRSLFQPNFVLTLTLLLTT
jgi:hypothetical protein